MSAYYLDASAAVKLYDREEGTDWVADLCDSASDNEIVLSRLGAVEIAAALASKIATVRGSQSSDEVKALHFSRLQRSVDQFRTDLARPLFTVVEINRLILARAIDIALERELRGYDAVHLATAVVLNEARATLALLPAALVSADHELLEAAQAEGLVTWNPNEQE